MKKLFTLLILAFFCVGAWAQEPSVPDFSAVNLLATQTGWYEIAYYKNGNGVVEQNPTLLSAYEEEKNINSKKYPAGFVTAKESTDLQEVAKTFVYVTKTGTNNNNTNYINVRLANGRYITYDGTTSLAAAEIHQIYFTFSEKTRIVMSSSNINSSTRHSWIPQQSGDTKYVGYVQGSYPSYQFSAVNFDNAGLVPYTVSVLGYGDDAQLVYSGEANYGLDKVYNQGTFFFSAGTTPEEGNFALSSGETIENIEIDTENHTITVWKAFTELTTLPGKVNSACSAIDAQRVGYPAKTSSQQSAINALLAFENKVTAANYNAAKAAYDAVVALTDLNRPVSGKAYKINFVYNGRDTKQYIKFDEAGIGLTTTASEATPLLFTEVDAQSHKYIMTLENGNLVTWKGGKDGYKINNESKGYSTMVANQGGKDDWNLCWFANQSTAENQFGTIKMCGRRTASSTSSWITTAGGGWQHADETSFFNANGGASSALQFEEVADISGESTGYKDGVEKYTLYTKAKAYDPHVGEGLCRYTYNTTQTSGLLNAVKACTTLEEERTIVNSIVINQPKNNTFIRIQNAGNDHKYVTCNNASQYRISCSTTKDVSSIFFFDGTHLLAYKTGYYMGTDGADKPFLHNNESVGDGIDFTFSASPVYPGTYNVRYKDGQRYLHENGDAGSDLLSNNSDQKYTFTLEQVTDLPVTLPSSGITTFYAPVDMQVNGDVNVYVGAIDDEETTITYTKLADKKIPAGTGVLIKGEPSANITISPIDEEVAAQSSCLLGHEYTVLCTQTEENHGAKYIYTLQSGVFQYYTGTKLTGFKAHLELNKDHRDNSGNSSLRIVFVDEFLTGIDAIEIDENTFIFDLQGRRVNNAQKGIYIMNGKKVMR